MSARADVAPGRVDHRQLAARCAARDRRPAPASGRTAPPAAACGRSRRTRRSAAASAISRSALCTSVSIDGATCARRARRAARLSSGAPANAARRRGGQARRLERARPARRRSGSVVAVVREPPAQRQHQLLLHPPAPHGQVAVRALAASSSSLHRLLVREVVLEPARRLGLVALARPRVAALEERAAHPLAQGRVLGQALDDDVARAGRAPPRRRRRPSPRRRTPAARASGVSAPRVDRAVAARPTANRPAARAPLRAPPAALVFRFCL